MHPAKILVVRLSSMGDVILATPLLRSLRATFPEAQIDVAIKKQFSSLVKHNPHLNKIIEVDTGNMSESKRLVAEEKYDWVIDIQKTSRGHQIVSASHAPQKTTYNKQKWKRWMLIRLKRNTYTTIQPAWKKYFEAVNKYNVQPDDKGTEVVFTPKEMENVQKKLGIYSHDTIVTLCPMALFKNKMWTREGFVELGKQLQQKHQATIVILGGPGEETYGTSIANAIGGKVLSLVGKLSLLESAALLQLSKLAVTNDSGLMHLAQSQKTPVVAIFGPTVKEFGFFPLPQKSTVVEKPLNCRPCTKMGKDRCPKGHHRCMKDIGADEVYTAAKTYL